MTRHFRLEISDGMGTFSASADKGGRFQEWTPRITALDHIFETYESWVDALPDF